MSESQRDDSPPAASLPTLLKAPDGRGASITALFSEERAPRMIKRRVIRSVRQIHDALHAADAEAREIVESARQEADAIREQARAEGYEAGIAQLTQALERARSEYARALDESEEDMLELAVRMAERIVRRQIELEPGVAAEITRGCLELVRDRTQVTVFVNPQDMPEMERWREMLVGVVAARSIHFEPDDAIGQGGCMIETEAGRVDARLEVQLESFKRALMS